MAYTKLFHSIITSTIWTENDRTRIVWITMLACADRNGEVTATIPGLARIAGVPVEDCREAIAKFLAPDADSRSKDDCGRRLQEIEGGWALLNYRKYREKASREDKLASTAKRVARHRANEAKNAKPVTLVTPVQNSNALVADGNAGLTPGLYKAEAEADAEKDRTKSEGGCGGAGQPPSAFVSHGKPPRVHHPSEAERIWQESWLRYRQGSDPYELTKADVLALNQACKKHSSEKLRSKVDALLGDIDPWVYANASPTLLVKRWSNLGGPKPVIRKLTQTEMATQQVIQAFRAKKDTGS